MEKTYDLYCEFDIDKHMGRYTNYLEVVIHSDGKVEYAVPSHQEKLISIGRKKFNVNREEFVEMCPPNRFADWFEWLLEVTECVSVWSCGYQAHTITAEQRKVMDLFIEKEIMKDNVIGW